LLLQGFTFYEQLLDKLQATFDFSVDAYVNSGGQGVRKSASRTVRLALVTCQRTMISLGDLARYREQASRTSNYGRARRLAVCLVSVSVLSYITLPTQPGHPSLGRENEDWQVAVVSGYGHHQGRNSVVCVTVGPVTRTAGILTQSVKGSGC